MTQKTIQRARSDREAFLHALHEHTGGSLTRTGEIEAIGRKVGLNRTQAITIERDLIGLGLIEPAWGTYVRLTPNGVAAVEAPDSVPSIINILTVGAMDNSNVQLGTSSSAQTVDATRTAPTGSPPLVAEETGVNLVPEGTAFGFKVCDLGPERLRDIVIWLVQRREDREPEDTPHATPQHHIERLDPDGSWHYFTLAQPGPSIGRSFHGAALVASWLDEIGRRRRGPILSTFIYA
jgi:hypothetical protein